MLLRYEEHIKNGYTNRIKKTIEETIEENKTKLEFVIIEENIEEYKNMKNIHNNIHKNNSCIDTNVFSSSFLHNNEIVSIYDADIEGFKRKCIFVKYNEVVTDLNMNITCIPNGSFIGWCNYLVRYNNCKLSFLIVSSICYKNRFSINVKNVSCDYLIDLRDNGSIDDKNNNIDDKKYNIDKNNNIDRIYDVDDENNSIDRIYHLDKISNMDDKNNNRNAIYYANNISNVDDVYGDVLPKTNHVLDEYKVKRHKTDTKNTNVTNDNKPVKNLKECIETNIKNNKVIVIPIEMTEMFLEVILHFFYMLNNIEICVCSCIFDKLNTIVNIQSEWLCETFANSIYSGQEPFSFKLYSNFKSYSSIYELTKKPQILFISINEYKGLQDRMYSIFDNQVVLQFNNLMTNTCYKPSCMVNFDISVEANVQELLENNVFTKILTSYEHENAEMIKPGKFYVFEEIMDDMKVKIKDTQKIQVFVHKNKAEFFVEGILTNIDEQIVIKPTKNSINEMMKTKRYFVIENVYYFYTKNVKVTFENDSVTITRII
ncbi:hypothetical protein BDAP_001803 [Binucleata daphniae]